MRGTCIASVMIAALVGAGCAAQLDDSDDSTDDPDGSMDDSMDEMPDPPGIAPSASYVTVSYEVWGTDAVPQYADGLDANGHPLSGVYATYNPIPNLQTILDAAVPKVIMLHPRTAGAVLRVRAPLHVSGATYLLGGTSVYPPVTDVAQVTGTRSNYAVRLAGQDTPNLPHPYRNAAVLTLSGDYIWVQNMYIEGRLGSVAISANGASHLDVRHIAVAGGWQGVIAAQNGDNVHLADIYASVLVDPYQPANQIATGSSFGIWAKFISNLVIEYCNTHADAYYNFGPPHSVGGPKVFSHVALYSVHTATVRHNSWYKSNDNALFATCVSNGTQYMTDCKLGGASAANRTTDLVIWDNQFVGARQSFFDIDHTDRVQILTNTLDHSDGGGVSLSDSTFGMVRYNHVGAACENLSPNLITFYTGSDHRVYIGGLGFQTGTRDTEVLDNTIDTARCPFAAAISYTTLHDYFGECMRIHVDGNRWAAQNEAVGDTMPGRNSVGTNPHL